MSNFLFNKSLIIGVGLIGSSLARGLRNKKLSKSVIGYDNNIDTKKKCLELKILDSMLDELDLIDEIDLIVLCSPLGSYNKILSKIIPLIKIPCIITDVGSTKVSVIKDFKNFKSNKFVEFVPCHPIAGLEKSGPEYGFEDLFNFQKFKIFLKSVRDEKN